MEIKLVYSYNTPEEVLDEGLVQLRKYRSSIDRTAPAYLVIFDRRAETKNKPWDERLAWTIEGDITVVGC